VTNVSFAELEEMSGELLPERAVLSTVSTPFNNFSSGAAGGGGTTVVVVDGGNHGATALSACTVTSTPGTPGLLGTLGLGSVNPGSSMTCVPAAVSSY
jgi:hypothetical protein